MNMFGILVALGLYAQTFVVTDVVTTPATETETESVVIVCEDFNGNLWEIETDDGDWFKGDIVTAIMDTKGTDTIYDDEVVCATYSGYIEGWYEREMATLETIEHIYE